MILHGGSQGELTLYNMPTEYVYEWTCEELQSKIDIGEGERIPTLLQLIELCDGHDDMLLNIELKGPDHPDFKPRYDFEAAARIVYQMILDHNIANKVMLSSFQPEIIDAMKTVSQENRKFMIHRLTETHGDPDGFQMHQNTEGINMYIQSASKEVTDKVQSQGGFVGIWWSAKVQKENDEMYDVVMKQANCDVFYSDNPLQAMKYRDELLASQDKEQKLGDWDEKRSLSSNDQEIPFDDSLKI